MVDDFSVEEIGKFWEDLSVSLANNFKWALDPPEQDDNGLKSCGLFTTTITSNQNNQKVYPYINIEFTLKYNLKNGFSFESQKLKDVNPKINIKVQQYKKPNENPVENCLNDIYNQIFVSDINTNFESLYLMGQYYTFK